MPLQPSQSPVKVTESNTFTGQVYAVDSPTNFAAKIRSGQIMLYVYTTQEGKADVLAFLEAVAGGTEKKRQPWIWIDIVREIKYSVAEGGIYHAGFLRDEGVSRRSSLRSRLRANTRRGAACRPRPGVEISLLRQGRLEER